MGIEPTSANFLYTAGCGSGSAARRLNRSALGDLSDSHQQINPGVFPGDNSNRGIALINLHITFLHGRANVLARRVIEPLPNVSIKQAQLFFRLCSDHLAIEAIPKKRLLIDLEAIRNHQSNQHTILLWTPHLVVLRNQRGHEVSLRRDGRMIIRKAESEEMAKRSAEDALNLALAISAK